jgi:hypothetical protein
MKLKAILLCVSLIAAPWLHGQDVSIAPDLRQAALPEAYMVAYGKHNPERDYQSAYLEQVWQTVLDEKIGDRVLAIITSRMPPEKLVEAKQLLVELQNIIEPVLTSDSMMCEETIYVQVMQLPTNHQLMAVKLKGDGAEKIDTSMRNFFDMVEKKSAGTVPLTHLMQNGVDIASFDVPPDSPFQPAYARMGNVILLSSHQSLLTQTIQALQNDAGVTKFDDPRFVDALKNLPEPEDSIVIFDGKQLFKQIRSLGDFIRQKSNNDPHAERAAQIMELVSDELCVIDYEVTVEYTEGNENRSTGLGKLTPDAGEKLLGKLILGGELFEDWQSWIPADAVAYSLSTGVRLHPAYERVMEILNTKYAEETREGLAKFEQAQKDLDLYLDRDILQSFSGEIVSITLPAAGEGQDSFLAVKCSNSDRIRALLHRLVDNLNKLPALQAQQINLTSAADLAGFESLNVATLAAFNMKPVIGFHDGWMMIGSNPACIQKVLDARAGKIPTIDVSTHFERFHLPVKGPVGSLGFTDIEKSLHNAADMIRKVGGIAPMFLAMVGANANAEDLKPAFEAIAILPSVAKVIEKFDFYQANLSVVQPGPLPDSYLKQSVTLIRPPAEK